MTPEAKATLDKLRHDLLRPASIAHVGGFRPPKTPLTSWFCRGVGRSTESLPLWQGEPMFPLIQVRVSELPFVPSQLHDIALLVLFHNLHTHPFDLPHGEGWLIREYADFTDLRPLPAVSIPYKPFPIRWSRVEDDTPGWEDLEEVIDASPIIDDESAAQVF